MRLNGARCFTAIVIITAFTACSDNPTAVEQPPLSAEPVPSLAVVTGPNTIVLGSGMVDVNGRDPENTIVACTGAPCATPLPQAAFIVARHPSYALPFEGTSYIGGVASSSFSGACCASTTTFENSFQLPNAASAAITISFHGDNVAGASINGVPIGEQAHQEIGSNFVDPAGSTFTATFAPAANGTNLLQVTLYNFTGPFAVDYFATVTFACRAGFTLEAGGCVNNPPIASAGGPYLGSEGGEILFDGSGSTDADGSALTYAWDFGDGSSGVGVSPSHAYADDGTYTVILTVTDAAQASTVAQAHANIGNVTPTVGVVAAPADPQPTGSAIQVSAAFTDDGTADTHTAFISWGDGSTSSGSVTETTGAGVTAGTHSYTAAGVYTITIALTDDDGGTVIATSEYVVVYEPSGGFVSGAGWIMSPAGAYSADPLLIGRASFGFVSRYAPGASVPSGKTEFHFRAGDLNFTSTSYEWLVVAGPLAQFRGTGSVNGEGSYNFLLTATDGQVVGGGGVDKFRIRITGPAGVIYDNVPGGGDGLSDADPQGLAAGSVVIHK
jgi:PKD repeat protein